MEITKHFTATTFIVNNEKVLLHLHKKLGIWLPIGGHIDRDELPEDAAVREAQEEAGLAVKLYNPGKKTDMDDVEQLVRPMHILLEDINQFHQHIDLIYYATSDTDKLAPQAGETTNLKWFTDEEVQAFEEAPMSVKALSLEAIKLLRPSNIGKDRKK